MATFAIGDIHGQLAPLQDVLAQVSPEVRDGDTVVFLGDYVDRGADSKGCVDAILAFKRATPATVVALIGNHEEWMLRSRRDPTYHSWLLSMDGRRTIRSYAPGAAEAIEQAAWRDRDALYSGRATLPYHLFFDAMPEDHRRFFESLREFHETTDCLCSHGGLDPAIDALVDQGRALIWGGYGFPEAYAGTRPVVYGHHNDADVDAADWPHARIIGCTYGLDTISHGVLTAIRLPGPTFYQSGRHQRRRDDD